MAPRWAAASIPRASPLTIVKPGAGEAAGQSFRLPQAIVRGMARADDAHGQAVLGLELPAHKQHARRIGESRAAGGDSADRTR